MQLSSLRDKAIEAAMVVVPGGVWLKALQEAVGDIADGHELRLAWRFAEAIAVSWVAWLMFRYLAVLDEAAKLPAADAAAESAPAPAANRYARLRHALAEGGGASDVYARLLTRVLAKVDRFFGDAGRAAPAWQRRLFFGLRAEAPLWTAPAYDRCLLLALVYPIGVLFLGWAISNHVGSAEAALRFKSVSLAWQRGLSVLSVVAMVASALWAMRAKGWRQRLFRFAIFGGALACAAAGAGGVAFAFAGAGAFAFAGTVAVAVAVSSAVAVAGAVSVALAVAIATELVKAENWRAAFLLVYSALLLAFCLALPVLLAESPTWDFDGPLLLFFGLLTILNAPFDWLSLGLTRGLLRRGLELQGPYPWLLALLDAALASLLIMALAATMVLGVQAFDAMAVWGGGNPVLPLQPLFDGLVTHPTDPEFWWLHALLLSTLLPSVVNLAVGGCSLLRGWPPLNAWLLRQLPEQPNADNLPANRYAVAGVLTAQWAVGAVLGIAAQWALVWLILGRLLPALGASLLDLMAALAQWNLPGRLILGG